MSDHPSPGVGPQSKRLPVKQPTMNPLLTVDVPARFANADVIEIRVTLTPLRWSEADERYARTGCGDLAGAQVQIVRLEARDSRAVFHIVRQMLRALVAEYLGLKDMF